MEAKELPLTPSSSKGSTYLRAGLVCLLTLTFAVGFYSDFFYSRGWSPESPSFVSSTVSSTAPVAETLNGTYVGIHRTESGVDEFLGVAFAQPPVNNLRFRKPLPLNTTWDGVREATTESLWCVGYSIVSAGHPGVEDCLYLNVYRPHGLEAESLPVAVYIHGGAFIGGGGSDGRYDPYLLMEQASSLGKPFVFVTIDYRMSLWGFLTSVDVMREGSTNIGLWDQRMALEWINENIRYFGGDPAKITIWGQSAGGSSVGFHLLSKERYQARPLFRAAIMNSGGPQNYEAFRSIESRQPIYDELVAKLGCSHEVNRLDCLRKVDFATIQDAVTHSWDEWSVTVDGDFFHRQPSDYLASSDIADVPIICGSNTGDGEIFVYSIMNTDDEFRSFLAQPKQDFIVIGAPPTAIDTIFDSYPAGPYPCIPPLLNCTLPYDPRGLQYKRAGDFATDFMFNAPRRATVRAWSSAGLDAYSYLFNIANTSVPGLSLHNSERQYIFNRTDWLAPSTLPEPYGDAQMRFANAAISFIHDLDPNSWLTESTSLDVISSTSSEAYGDPLLWPKYDPESPQLMFFDAQEHEPLARTRVEDDVIRDQAVEAVIRLMPDFGR